MEEKLDRYNSLLKKILIISESECKKECVTHYGTCISGKCEAKDFIDSFDRMLDKIEESFVCLSTDDEDNKVVGRRLELYTEDD